jgi:hypothetical protein
LGKAVAPVDRTEAEFGPRTTARYLFFFFSDFKWADKRDFNRAARLG